MPKYKVTLEFETAKNLPKVILNAIQKDLTIQSHETFEAFSHLQPNLHEAQVQFKIEQI